MGEAEAQTEGGVVKGGAPGSRCREGVEPVETGVVNGSSHVVEGPPGGGCVPDRSGRAVIDGRAAADEGSALLSDGPHSEGKRAGSGRLETAVFGGGCFWCLEAVFAEVAGVESVRSGYAGGHTANPGYREVCSGATGHAEVVRLRFDASVIGFRELLEIFFTIHDPTTLNRQGADRGTQYRSVVLHASESQRETAESLVAELDAADLWADPIVTELAPLDTFHPAEKEHDRYYARNRLQPYCAVVVAPKVAKFRKRFAHRMRAGEAKAGVT